MTLMNTRRSSLWSTAFESPVICFCDLLLQLRWSPYALSTNDCIFHVAAIIACLPQRRARLELGLV